MSGFNAKGLLEKFGWTEGKGLGATSQGRAEAVFVRFRGAQDNTGVGKRESWNVASKGPEYAEAFDNAANNLSFAAEAETGGVTAVSAVNPALSTLPTIGGFRAGPIQRPEDILGKTSLSSSSSSSSSSDSDSDSKSSAGSGSGMAAPTKRSFRGSAPSATSTNAATVAAEHTALANTGRQFMYQNRCSGKLKRLMAHDTAGYDPALIAQFTAPPPATAAAPVSVPAPSVAEVATLLDETELAAAAEKKKQKKADKKRKREAEAAEAEAAAAATAAAAEKEAKKKRKTEKRERRAADEAAAAATAAAEATAAAAAVTNGVSTPPPPAVSADEPKAETAEERRIRKEAKKAKKAAKAEKAEKEAAAAAAAVALPAAEVESEVKKSSNPDATATAAATAAASKAESFAAAAAKAVDAAKLAKAAAKKARKEARRAERKGVKPAASDAAATATAAAAAAAPVTTIPIVNPKVQNIHPSRLAAMAGPPPKAPTPAALLTKPVGGRRWY